MMEIKKLPPWHKEIQQAIQEIGLVYCLNSKDLIPFLTATLCGQFAIAGLKEDFVKATLDRMFESYKTIKSRGPNA
jgi:hypothetical protein